MGGDAGDGGESREGCETRCVSSTSHAVALTQTDARGSVDGTLVQGSERRGNRIWWYHGTRAMESLNVCATCVHLQRVCLNRFHLWPDSGLLDVVVGIALGRPITSDDVHGEYGSRRLILRR